MDTKATDDAIFIDIEVPCSTAHGDHTTADVEGDIGSRKADAVVRTLLEEEVSRESLPRDFDLHIVGLDTKEATLWKTESVCLTVDGSGLSDRANGGVDTNAKGRARAQPRNVEGNITIESTRDSVVVDQ